MAEHSGNDRQQKSKTKLIKHVNLLDQTPASYTTSVQLHALLGWISCTARPVQAEKRKRKKERKIKINQ